MSTPYGPQEPAESVPTPPSSPEERAIVVPAQPASSASDPSTPSAAAESQQYYRPSIPGENPPGDNRMIMRPTSTTHAFIRGGLAVLLVIMAVVNQFWAARFPSNAPVEMIFALGITVDLIATAVVLGIFAILASARRSVPVKPQSVSPMAVAAIVLSSVVTVAWLLFNLVPVLVTVSNGDRYQYMTAVGALFILGVPWVLGMVFGTLSLRSGGRLTPILATIAIALGVLLAIAAVVFSVIYGLALSN